MTAMTKDRPHCVYRLWDADGDLLYVGMTGDLSARMSQHRSDKAWWPTVARTYIQAFPNRSDALAAEQAAIDSEAPRYNREPGRKPDDLPPAVVKRLRAARDAAAKADAAYRREVRAALRHGSVRRVAAALGISPTTVQKWSAEQ